MAEQDSKPVADSSINRMTDYSSIEIPTKPPENYTYGERRAELLQQMRDLGHPQMINRSRQAERYGVSHQQISKDIDKLAEYMAESPDDRRELKTTTVLDKCISGLLENEEYRKAAQTMIDYNDWAAENERIEEIEETIAELKESRS